jgi:hypothetical protein
MGFRIDTNKDCLTNPLDGRDVEDRVGHCFLRVIPRYMDWAVRPPEFPLVGVWYISTSRLIPRVIWRRKKNGKDVGVWYIPTGTRHVKLDL